MSTATTLAAGQARHAHIDPKIEREYISCDLCGRDDAEPVISAPDPVTHIGGRFDVVRCRLCSLAYTNPRPTPASIGVFYQNDYNPYASNGPEHAKLRFRRKFEQAVLVEEFGYPGRRTFATKVAAQVGRAWVRDRRQQFGWIPYRAPGRLLDFGCGAGDYLVRMRACGWNVEGIDFAESVAQDVHARTGIKVHVGTLPHSDLAPGSYDAVTMWNALEHVHSPRATVRAAGEVLRTGGLLVIGVPNFDSWAFEQFQNNWFPLDLPRHLTHFTPQTLTETLTREGFKVHSIDQIGRGGWIKRSAKMAEKAGVGPKWLRACRYTSVAQRLARMTEKWGRADFIRAVAEKA